MRLMLTLLPNFIGKVQNSMYEILMLLLLSLFYFFQFLLILFPTLCKLSQNIINSLSQALFLPAFPFPSSSSITPFSFLFLQPPAQSRHRIILYLPSMHFQLTCLLPGKSSCIRISTALIPPSCQLNHVEFKPPKFFIRSSFAKREEFCSLFLSVSFQFCLNNYYLRLHSYSPQRLQLTF